MTGELVFFRDGIVLLSDKWDIKRKNLAGGRPFPFGTTGGVRFKTYFLRKAVTTEPTRMTAAVAMARAFLGFSSMYSRTFFS